MLADWLPTDKLIGRKAGQQAGRQAERQTDFKIFTSTVFYFFVVQ